MVLEGGPGLHCPMGFIGSPFPSHSRSSRRRPRTSIPPPSNTQQLPAQYYQVWTEPPSNKHESRCSPAAFPRLTFTLANVTVRPATMADMPGKQAINAYYVEHTLTELDYAARDAIAELRMYNERLGSYLVAVAHDTAVVGWVQISTHR